MHWPNLAAILKWDQNQPRDAKGQWTAQQMVEALEAMRAAEAKKPKAPPAPQKPPKKPVDMVPRLLSAALRGLLWGDWTISTKWDRNQARNPAGASGGTGGQFAKAGQSASAYGTRILPGTQTLENMPPGPERAWGHARRAGRLAKEQRERVEEVEDAYRKAFDKGVIGAGYNTILNAPTGEGFKNTPRGVNISKPAPEPKSTETLEALKQADSAVTGSRPLGGGANASVIVTLEDGTEAVYKPERGENWGPGFANQDISHYVTNKDFSLAEREAFAFEVDQAIGLGIVPETVLHERVDETNITDLDTSGDGGGGGGGYDSYDARQAYDSYREKAQDDAMEAVGQEMYDLFGQAQEEHLDKIKARSEEMTKIWNEEVEDFPDKESPYGSDSVLQAHPALPMGTQPGFQRVVHVGSDVLDPLEMLKEADVDMDGPLNTEEKKNLRAVLRKHLEEGAQELGDVDEDAAREHLEYDTWVEDHADTEGRLLESKIQSFTDWRHDHGYDSNNSGGYGGGGSDRNTEAPHPEGGSFQHFRENADSWGHLTDETGPKLAVLDYVIGTMDRHGNNLMFEDGQPIAIDNGYSMPATTRTDDFQFRSEGVSSWLASGQDVPSDLRDQLHHAVTQADWKALADRHPNMNSEERDAFLERAENMKIALQTEEGLRELWERLDRY